MKKILAIFLALLTVSVMAISVSAEFTFANYSEGHYFVMNFDDPDSVFAADKYFNWGYCGGLAKADGTVLIPKGTAAGTEMSIGHASNIAKDGGHAGWITATLKYAAVTYKTAAEGAIGLKFAPTAEKWESTPAWAPEDYQVVTLPAANDFTTVIVALDAAVQYTDPLFLFCFTSGGATEDIYLKNIGFFASEAEAKTYYNIQDPAPEQPADPEQPAPETGDVMTSAIVVAAIALGLGVVVTKKKIAR